jgi:hypothetical protein
MSIDPDAFERSRAAVAVSCLRWLQCTGPARADDRPVADPAREAAPLVRVTHAPAPPASAPHPLWDRWLDG